MNQGNQNNFEKEEQSWRTLTIPGFQSYFEATVIETEWALVKEYI